MSAYGAVTITNRPVGHLTPTTWDLPQSTPGKPTAPFRRLVLHHLRLASARASPAGPSLLEYTHRIFAAEVEAGRTYPQEADALAAVPAAAPAVAATTGSTRILSGKESEDLDLDLSGSGSGSGSGDTDTDTDTDARARANATQAYTRTAFEAYFWAADVIVAIGQTDEADDGGGDDGRVQAHNVRSGSGDLLEISRGGRSWEDALVGFYYVKPNYPGRSSHICNAGFIICPAHREFGYGKTLGKSYLHYGPALGYKASVFNLVYANNTGSLRIWDSLGFTRAGFIPRAGRLRRADGNGEEWADSVIYYRSFVEEEEWSRPIA